MCSPTLIIAGVTTAVSLYQTNEQRQAAKAGNKAAKQQQQIEVTRARQEAMDRENQLSQDALIESTKLNKERTELALEALREQAAVRIGSAEGGLGGVSKVRSFLTTDIQEDLARSDIDTNARNAQFNLAQAQRGIEATEFARRQNAFLTRQANTQKVPGAFEFISNAGAANQSGLSKVFSGGGGKKKTSTTKSDTGGGSSGGTEGGFGGGRL